MDSMDNYDVDTRPQESAEPSGNRDAGPESLDKVRDILFGSQMRMVESRFHNLEELQAINAELRDALGSLERRHMNLEQAAGMADADLRDQLLQHSSAITSEIARLSERVSSD